MPTKPKIKAGDAVKDIRSGMTDAQILEKHGTSANGLHSPFLKLLEVSGTTSLPLKGPETDKMARPPHNSG